MLLIRGSQSIGISRSGAFSQKYVKPISQVGKIIRQSWETASLFASAPFRYSAKKRNTEYFVDRLFIDLDAHESDIMETFADLLKLQWYAGRMNTECHGFLTDNGIHAHFLITPQWTDNPESVVTAKRKITKRLNLKTADWGAFALSRMPRIPNSVTNRGFAIHIKDNEFPDETLKKATIRRAFPTRKKDIDLNIILSDNIDIDPNRPVESPIICPIEKLNDSEIVSIFSKPCIRHHILRDDAPSYMRWVAGIHLKKMGFSINQGIEIFKQLTWDDWDESKTRYFLGKAFEYNWAPSCAKIMASGYCIGKICPYWNKATGCTNYDRGAIYGNK